MEQLKRNGIGFVTEQQKPTASFEETGMLNGVVVDGARHKKAIEKAIREGKAKRRGGASRLPNLRTGRVRLQPRRIGR